MAQAVAFSILVVTGRSLRVRMSFPGEASAAPSAAPPLAPSAASTSTSTFASTSASSGRPTHFVSLRLADPELHRAVGTAQAEVVARGGDKRLAACAVPPEKTHLTAFVMKLEGEGQLARARAALRGCAALLPPPSSSAEVALPPCLELRGVGHFGQRVVYVDCPPSEEQHWLSTFVDGAARIFSEHGIAVQHEPGAWRAHVTLLKTSRYVGRGRGKPPNIRKAAYEGLEGRDFGRHALRVLELCSMQGEGIDGFYRVEAALPLDGPSRGP